MNARPFAAVAGITSSPPGAATHRYVALWFCAQLARNAEAVRVGPTEKTARPEVAIGAPSAASSACGVRDEPGVPAVVQRCTENFAALSAGVASEPKTK